MLLKIWLCLTHCTQRIHTHSYPSQTKIIQSRQRLTLFSKVLFDLSLKRHRVHFNVDTPNERSERKMSVASLFFCCSQVIFIILSLNNVNIHLIAITICLDLICNYRKLQMITGSYRSTMEEILLKPDVNQTENWQTLSNRK